MSDRDDSQDEGVQDSQDEVVRDLYPEEFARLAIGVPINADSNKVMLLTRAFDGGKLANSGLFVDPKPSTYGGLELRAGASDSKTQDTSGWNASASMKLNLGIADFSAKFYVQQEQNACKRSARAALVGHSFKKCELVLQDTASTQQWYNCTTEDFRNKFEALSKAAKAADSSAGANATDLQALARALGDFYGTYGTGFVCGLQLIAYGIVEGSWDRQTSSTTDDFTIGGGIAASLPFVGFDAAGEYVKTQAQDTVKTTLTVRALGRPETSPQFQWAAAKAEALDGHSLEEFLNGEAWSKDAAKKVSDPENPKLEYDAIDITQFVIPELPGGLGALSNAIKALQASTVKRVDGAQSGSQTGGEAPEATPVNAKVAALKSIAAFTEDEINDVAFGRTHIDQPAEAAVKSAVQQGNPLRADDGNTDGGNGSRVTELNLGDYVPCGYYYRAWEDIFPELGLALECTPAQVVFGQSLVWYSMREMFAQYLKFCGDFRGVSRNPDGTSLDIATRASAFRAALDEVGDYLADALTKETAKSDLNFVQKLEQELESRLKNHHFDMSKHYRFWIDNYDWLKLAPFGVVAVIDRGGKLWYQQSPYPGNPMVHSIQPDGCAPVPSCMPADLLVHNAYRLYPIISTSATGEPHFVWVGAASHLKGDNDDASLRYSGRFALNRGDPAETPAAMSKNWERKRLPTDTWQATGPFHVVPDDVVLNEVALPMLIHQSKDAAEEILRAESDLDWDCLVERWTNRKRVFGLHLYAGVGDDDCFGHLFSGDGQDIGGDAAVARLREIAGHLAQDAAAHAQVLPQLPKKDEQDDAPPIWALQEPQGVVGAYFAAHDATFFWGPAAGSGWDLRQPGSDKHLFTQCPVKFIPVDFGDVSDALKSIGEDFEHFDHKTAPAWATAGGGAMWRQPRARLMQRLKALSGESEDRRYTFSANTFQ